MTPGIDSDSDSVGEYYEGFSRFDAVHLSVTSEVSIEQCLKEFKEKIEFSRGNPYFMEDALNRFFSIIVLKVRFMKLSEVADTLESLMGSFKSVRLDTHCQEIIISNVIEMNVKIPDLLEPSQSVESKSKKYFKRLHDLFVEECAAWDESCFRFIQQKALTPYYTYNLFTRHLDVITLLTVTRNEGVEWKDFESFYDALLVKYFERLHGIRFGDQAILQYVKERGGRVVSAKMGRVIASYLNRPCFHGDKAFDFLMLLWENRQVTRTARALIVRELFSWFFDAKTLLAKDYVALMYQLLIPESEGEKLALWEDLQDVILPFLKKIFTHEVDLRSVSMPVQVKNESEFSHLKNELKKMFEFWKHHSSLHPAINDNKNSFTRYVLCSLMSQLNALGSNQFVEIFSLLQGYLSSGTLSELSRKMVLAVMLSAIDLEYRRDHGNVILENAPKYFLIDKTWLPIVETHAEDLFREACGWDVPPHYLIERIATLIRVGERELMLRLCVQVGDQASFREFLRSDICSSCISSEDEEVILDVVESSGIASSANVLAVYLEFFKLSPQFKVKLVEKIFDRVLESDRFMYGELVSFLRLLIALSENGIQDSFFGNCHEKLQKILQKRFTIRELMVVSEYEGLLFHTTAYTGLLAMLSYVIDVYRIDFEDTLMKFHTHWVLEGVSSLRLLRKRSLEKLEQMQLLVTKRRCFPAQLIQLEQGISDYKERLLEMIVMSYQELGECKEKMESLLAPFVGRPFYDRPLNGESCLVFVDGELKLIGINNP